MNKEVTIDINEILKQEHKERHQKLHRNFDELLADFIRHTQRLLSKTTVLEFLEWSHQQTINPTP
jgi:hypothetical protein